MLTLRKAVAGELFREAKGPIWTGRVFSISRNQECVPCLIDGKRFIVEFNIPYFLTQAAFYEDILIPRKGDGVFIPRLEHRFINVFHVEGKGEIQNLCKLGSDVLPRNPSDLIKCMQAAVITFYRSAPHANQFFFRYDPKTRDLLRSMIFELSPEIQSKYTLERYDDLREPFLGFSIVSNAL